MEVLECILGDSEILTKQLSGYPNPRCGAFQTKGGEMLRRQKGIYRCGE